VIATSLGKVTALSGVDFSQQLWVQMEQKSGTTYTVLGTRDPLGLAPYALWSETVTGPISLPTNGLVVGTNQLAVVGGNLGIGTTTPKNKLDVEGGAAIGATYSGTNTAPPNGLLVEGSVGIGTVSPQANLHVNGNMRLQAGGPINEFSTDGTLSGNSDAAVPTEKAVRTFIGNFIQSGRFGAGVGTAGWNLRDGAGERTFRQGINFPRNFSMTPKVMIGMVNFDFETIRNQRINAYTQNVTASGFDIVFTTWADTKCWSVTVEGLAYGP
jgi:hypothetical protein